MPDSIIERLTKARGPDRELDLEISVAVNFKFVFEPKYNWRWGAGGDEIEGHINGKRRACLDPVQFVPRWTKSIDTTLTLLPEGWAWFVEWIGAPFSEGMARLWIPAQRTQGLKVESIQVTAATPALALLTSIMKARQS